MLNRYENARNVFAAKPTLLLSLAMLVLALVAVGWTGGMPAANAQQGSAPVTVVNTPLPVSLSGTGTITGDVNASQAGAWNVGVTSLPSVQLAPGTTVGVTGVDVNVNAKNAFVVDLCANPDETHNICGGAPASLTLPLGTRYVIEQVSGRCKVDGMETINGVRLVARVNSVDHNYGFRDHLTHVGGDPVIGYFFQETRIYADGGAQDGVVAHILDNAASTGSSCKITLSGYLVNTTPIFPTQP